tara:strand:- start:258 stop:1103 length:846 start_codon:yes stop_codon:yes gene_type:complete
MIISENIIEISSKYLLIINNYNKFFFKNIAIYKNEDFIKILHIKGLYLISNIFNISLLYIDSLVDIYNLCEKGYIYFVEFINQININYSYESCSFELTLKDAVIFSYKKTIFTFDNKIQTNISDDNKFRLQIINHIVYIINNLSITLCNNVYHLYNYQNKLENINQDSIYFNTLNLTKLVKKIFTVTDLNSKQFQINSNYIVYFKNINSLIEYINLHYKNIHATYNKNFYNNVIIFIEKYIIKKIFLKNIDIKYHIDYNALSLLNNHDNILPLLNSLGKII